MPSFNLRTNYQHFDTFERVGVSECLITYMNHFLIEKFKSVLTSFQTMKKADQEKYLLLSNKYDESDTLNEELSEWLKRNTDISKNKASTIVGVFVSNMYEMGVGIGKYVHIVLIFFSSSTFSLQRLLDLITLVLQMPW